MSGELLHSKGEEGARRAKHWLDSTTRANARWVNPNPTAVPKLTFQWADGTTFSYDIGGLLIGGEFEGQEFLVESKFYKTVGHQGEMYTEYLAKCYRAFTTRPDRCDNFMWITWHPFSVTKWAKLCSAEEVKAAAITHRVKCLGCDDQDSAEESIDDEICKEVSNRLWLILLSKRQEDLVISKKHLGWIRDRETAEED